MSELDALLEEVNELHRLGVTPEYAAKQLHRIPTAPVVDRAQYILQHCQGKRALHLGCGWPAGYLHQCLVRQTEEHGGSVLGVDIDVPLPAPLGFASRNFDELPLALPWEHEADILVVAEVLEHLGNPGRFLSALPRGVPLLITVPNAFAAAGRYHLSGGLENVHTQHVAWYSYTTLKELVTRYHYLVIDFAWYNCPRNRQPQESEGLIMLVRAGD